MYIYIYRTNKLIYRQRLPRIRTGLGRDSSCNRQTVGKGLTGRQRDRQLKSLVLTCLATHYTRHSELAIYAVVHIECDLPIESREPSATAKDVKHVDTKQMTGQNKHGNICLGGLQTASKWSGP